MPFSIRKQGKKFQVINSETGDVKGEHASEADAKKQLAALYVNVPDARKETHMDIITKAVNATIEDTSANAQEFPGTFLVELSNESLDRDGETLKGDEWETPLPQQITFVNDHTHKMASVVGSAKPELVGGKIICKGEWAATDNAQDTRKVIKHVPYVSVAYREKRNQKAGTVTRELVNGSFVVVPSNIRARVLASKSFDGEGLDDEVKALVQDIVKETLKSAGVAHGGDTVHVTLDDQNRHGLTFIVSEKDSTITVKQHQEVLGTHKFSQSTKEAPSKDADPGADSAEDEAAALDQIKAAAMSMQTRHLVDERELDHA